MELIWEELGLKFENLLGMGRMDSAARESGCKKLLLLVFIKKQVIVPHGEYLAMLKAKQAQEILHQVEDMVRLQAQGWEFRQSDWEDIANV
ncbi:hypothetical protein REPUB_Repub01dG0128900 [Reevesia pubescens]